MREPSQSSGQVSSKLIRLRKIIEDRCSERKSPRSSRPEKLVGEQRRGPSPV